MSCVMIAGACLLNAALLSFDAGYQNPYQPEQGIKVTENPFGYGEFVDIVNLQFKEDGTPRHFYRDEQTNWQGSVGLFFRGGTFVRLGYDHGIDTKKFDVAKRYDIEVRQRYKINESSSIVVGAGTSFGGEVRHTNCYNRILKEAYFCEDSRLDASIKNSNNKRYNLSLKYSYRF